MIVTDLELIKKQSKAKEDQNWRFRVFLKSQNYDKIDLLVRQIYLYVCNHINCMECANCCRMLTPSVTNADIAKLAKLLSISRSEVIEKYTETDQFNERSLKVKPCVFLEKNVCTIYDNRPADCKSYPHLHKKSFISRLFGVIENAEICPIVYNTYEELKIKMKFR